MRRPGPIRWEATSRGPGGVAPFELIRGQVADRRMPPVRVVPALDPLEHRRVRLGLRRETRAVEQLAVDAAGSERLRGGGSVRRPLSHTLRGGLGALLLLGRWQDGNDRYALSGWCACHPHQRRPGRLRAHRMPRRPHLAPGRRSRRASRALRGRSRSSSSTATSVFPVQPPTVGASRGSLPRWEWGA